MLRAFKNGGIEGGGGSPDAFDETIVNNGGVHGVAHGTPPIVYHGSGAGLGISQTFSPTADCGAIAFIAHHSDGETELLEQFFAHDGTQVGFHDSDGLCEFEFLSARQSLNVNNGGTMGGVFTFVSDVHLNGITTLSHSGGSELFFQDGILYHKSPDLSFGPIVDTSGNVSPGSGATFRTFDGEPGIDYNGTIAALTNVIFKNGILIGQS